MEAHDEGKRDEIMDFNIVDKNYRPDAVILADGSFPTVDVPLEVLRSARYLCCCDGAAVTCVKHGIVPDAIVGDGDSLPEDFKKRFADRLSLVSEQENNDLTKATLHCAALGHRFIAYIGATGKREDHTIGNVSLLEKYMSELDLSPVMLTDYGYFVPVSGTITLSTKPRQQVSIFNLTASSIVGEGLRWPCYAYRGWWQGTLNEAIGDSVTINSDGKLIVYITYKPKGDAEK